MDEFSAQNLRLSAGQVYELRSFGGIWWSGYVFAVCGDGNTPEGNIDPNGLTPRGPDIFASLQHTSQAVGGGSDGASRGGDSFLNMIWRIE